MGKAGVGKTALFAATALQLIEQDPNAILVLHFTGIHSDACDYNHIIWRIVSELTEVPVCSS